jgi:hypothetical protein
VTEKASLELELALVEYTPLREEVNRTIDRMTNNEVICGGFVYSIIAFLITVEIPIEWPSSMIHFIAAIVAIFVAFGGERRSAVFRRHMDQVDNYLAQIESKFGSNIGWTDHYRRTMERLDTSRQVGTRIVFWHMLKFLALLATVFVLFRVFIV